MKNTFEILFALAALGSARHESLAQGFVNLDFESATVTAFPQISANAYTAVLAGWTYGGNYNYVTGDPNSIPYNGIALDSAAVVLEGMSDPFGPSAIQGMYSLFIQGGSQLDPNTEGASIMQAGQIPASAQSITYWGGSLQATFNGQPLVFAATGSGPGYTIWQANIAPYAGQTGQLAFAAPWQTEGLLDNIQFSSSPVPEPGIFALVAFGGVVLGIRRWRSASQ